MRAEPPPETQAELHESDTRLRLALEAGQLGIWDWDLPSGRIRWSPSRELMHGRSPGTFGGTVEEFRSDLHPDDEARVMRAVEEALAGGDTEYRAEYRILRPDGEVRWLESRGRIDRDEHGNAVRMHGVCADTTDRKRIETGARFLAEANRVLNASIDFDATLQTVVELAVPEIADSCTVFLVDPEGELRPAALAHRDPGRREPFLRHLERHPPSREVGFGLHAVIRSGEPRLVPVVTPEALSAASRDAEHRAALKELRLRSLMMVPLNARGQTLGVMGFAAVEPGRRFGAGDLEVAEKLASGAALAIDNARLFAEAQRARVEAQKAARRLDILAETSNLLASTLDPDEAMKELARLVVAKLTDCCVTYRLEEDGTVRRVGVAHAVPEKTRWVEELLELGSPSLSDEYGAGAVLRTSEPLLAPEIPDELLRRATSGEDHLRIIRELGPLSSLLVPLRARDRTIGAIALATTRDSGRRHGEDDLTLAEELASRAALALDNIRLYQEAQDAVRIRQELMEVLSHDLRVPLHTIAMTVSLIEEGSLEEDSLRPQLAIIKRTVNRMGSLVQDLLDVSQLEGGQLRLHRTILDAGRLLREVQEAHAASAERKGVELEAECATEGFRLEADRERIHQVFSNLIGNAIKFTPAAGSVILRARRHGREAIFSVEDTGPGIPDGDLPHLFERFWQAQHGKGGAGLGLAISAGIVEAHSGRIWVESEVERGTAIHFALPLAAPGPGTPAP